MPPLDDRQTIRGPLMRLACSVLLAALLPAGGSAQAPAPGARYLVIPFEQTGDGMRAAWLGEAASVILTDDLSAIGAAVISREDRVRALDRLRIPPVTSLSHATVIRLGQLVAATDVVVGTFETDGSALRVKARTIRLDTGRMSAEIVETGPASGLFELCARVARRLVPDSAVSVEQMAEGHPPIRAFEQYIRGLVAGTPASRPAHLGEALRIWPSFQRARVALWAVHSDAGDHENALAAIRDVPAEHRLARQAQFLAGVSMSRLGRYAEAYAVFARLHEARADSALSNNLGIVQLRRAGTGTERASLFFARAVEQDAHDPDLHFNLGYARWLEGDAPGAIQALREAVRRNPADGAAHFVLGVALQAGGSAAEAAREKALARQLSSVYAAWEAKQGGNTVPRGLERLKTELDLPAALRVESAIVAAEQRDHRELAVFHRESGRRLVEAERYAEAISELRRAVYLSPYDSRAHVLLGRAYARSGRMREAIDALRISIWSEETIEARLALADVLIQVKDVPAARAELDAVLTLDPGNAQAEAMAAALR